MIWTFSLTEASSSLWIRSECKYGVECSKLLQHKHNLFSNRYFYDFLLWFCFSQIKLVSKPLWRQDGKWHIAGTRTTQETIAFFHTGRPLRSYKCHLWQRHYLLQDKTRAKTPQKKFYFLNWHIQKPLFYAHTILSLPPPQRTLQNHSSSSAELHYLCQSQKYCQDLWTGTDLSESHVDIYTRLSVK